MSLTEGQRKILEKKRNEAKGKSAQNVSQPQEGAAPQEPQQLPLDAIELVNEHRAEADNMVAKHSIAIQQAMIQRSQSLEDSVDSTAQMVGFKDALTIMGAQGKAAAYTADYLEQFNSLQVNPNVAFTALDDLELQIQESLKRRPALFAPSTRQLAYQDEIAALTGYEEGDVEV